MKSAKKLRAKDLPWNPLYLNDPRLIVYKPKRPQLPPLPKQKEFATKYWIISQLSHVMMPNKSKNNHTISSNLKTPTEASIPQLQNTCNIPQTRKDHTHNIMKKYYSNEPNR